MKIGWANFNIKGSKVQAKITIPEKSDRELLKKLYFDWNNLNKRLKAISTRGINLPETSMIYVYMASPSMINIKKTMGHPHLKVGVCKAPCFRENH